MMSDINLSGGNIFEQSPEISFQGVRQQLSFYSPNTFANKNTNSNNKFNNFNIKLLTEKENDFNMPGVNFDIDKFFKSINFEGGIAELNTNNSLSNNINQISFRKIVFDDLEAEETAILDKENDELFNFDKENSPPIPRESSKYSYIDAENNFLPVEINLEAGLSHIVSDSQKIIEIPLTLDFKMKENTRANLFSKDFIVILNTISLNVENIYQIFKIITDKIGDSDRIFTNIFKFEKWVSKDECKQILSEGNFENYLQETSFLNYVEISKLITYCVDLSFEHHAHLFSVILINDIESIPVDVDYMDEIKFVANKLKESKVNLIKNFTINCILLDHARGEEQKTPQNIKSISFFYDLSMLCMGYFFSPKVNLICYY